jgi:hypothetical protein
MTALLHPHRGSATKTIGPNGVVCDYAAGGKFVGRNITIPLDVTALADWLRIQTKRDEFLIAGAIRDGRGDMRTLINRRYLERAGWAGPDIIDVPQTVLIIDCDGAPGSCDFRVDPVAAAASVRDMVSELKGVACVFVGSSRAGTNALARGKFFFILSAPKRAPELKAWAEDANQRTGRKVADRGLYNPVQPIYLATPQFVDEMADPMPERVLVLPGDVRPVALPDVHHGARAFRPHARVTTEPQTRAAGRLNTTPSVNDALACGISPGWTLENALAEAAAAVPGTRNDTFARQAFTAGLRAQDLGLDPEKTINALLDAAAIAGSNDAKTDDTITRCFSDGMRRAEEDAAAMAALSPATVAASSAGGATGWTAAHELAALKVAKARLHDTFVVAELLGRHRIRSSLVRACMAVSNASVRARLMFVLAAFLIKANHSPEEIVDAVSECGFPRAHGVNALLWAQKNIRKGDDA